MVALAAVAQPLGWIGAILTTWCTYFFRDPDRLTPTRDGLVICPADGLVQAISAAAPPPELDMGDEPRPRISIFMDVFDVHVNRVPCDGTVRTIRYHPGKFFNASLDKASEHNERQCYRLQLPSGEDLAFVQIAGLIARRIKCFVAEGQAVKAGERFGLIRFGSRVDVYLPNGTAPLVAVGQRTLAGETVLADFLTKEPPRDAVVR